AGDSDHAGALAARITEAQAIVQTALRLFLDLAQHRPPTTSEDLLLLDHVAQIAKAAQDAGAELAAASPAPWRTSAAASGRVVLIGPSPRQFIESATDLLDRIPALCHAIHRDRLIPPGLPTHQSL
ncbi:hypothetical protein ACN6K9_005747, partial [Streptomyces sp. SAS_267]|uniref:hypothetical protein n=1 Tax=Streptomyces sp. SAS_267 TaxID=3412750 RepID=UPI00403CBB76